MSKYESMKEQFFQETGLRFEDARMTYISWLQIKMLEEISQKLDDLSVKLK